VIVSRFVAFDSGGAPPAFEKFDCAVDVPGGNLIKAKRLFAANQGNLPETNPRPPRIVHGNSQLTGVVTTKGFKYDDSANTFGLQEHGRVCEMGDAVLADLCRELGDRAPEYGMVRNVSDPQIDSNDPEAGRLANWIYEHFGRWSTVCSAITCWGIVADLQLDP
jgi:hypothetical protein